MRKWLTGLLSLSILLSVSCTPEVPTDTTNKEIDELKTLIKDLKDNPTDGDSNDVAPTNVQGRILLPSNILIPSGITLPSRVLLPSGILIPSGIKDFSLTQTEQGKPVLLGKDFKVEVRDEAGKVLAEVETDDEGQFKVDGILAKKRIKTKAIFKKDSNLTLKAYLDVPEEKTEELNKDITARSTAIAELADKAESQGGEAAKIKISQYETSPDLVALVDRVENKIIKTLETKLDKVLEEISDVNTTLNQVLAELEALKKAQPILAPAPQFSTQPPLTFPSTGPNENPIAIPSAAATPPLPQGTPAPSHSDSGHSGSNHSAAGQGGGKIVFTSTKAGNREIFSFSGDNDNPATQLTNTDGQEKYPKWSPDGKRILFAYHGEGNPKIQEIKADGSGLTNIVTGDYPSYSPNGSKVVYVKSDEGSMEIYTRALYSSQFAPKRLTNNAFDDIQPDWSPDGESIVFASQRNGEWNIYKMNTEGLEVVRLSDGAEEKSYPVWSPDGSKIAFLKKAGVGKIQVFIMDANGKNVQQMTSDDVDHADGLAWSPDGHQLVITYASRDLSIITVNSDAGGFPITQDSQGNKHPDWKP